MKEKYSKSRLLLYFLRGSKRYFITGIVFGMLVTLLDLVNPKIISFTIDGVIGKREPKLSGVVSDLVDSLGGVGYLRGHLYVIALGIIVVALAGIFCRYMFTLMNSKGAETFVMTMRNELFRHIEGLPYKWHSENKTGDIIQRCTSDVETIKRFLSEQLIQVFRIVILVTFAFAFMLGIHPLWSLVAGVFMPVILGLSLHYHKQFGKIFMEADENEGILSSIAQENLTGVRVVRAFGRESYERDRFLKQNKHYFGIWSRFNHLLSKYWSIADVISGFQFIAVIAVGSYLAVSGQITAGQYIAFVSYNSMVIWPIRQLGRVLSQMSKAGVSIERVKYIMNSELESDRVDAVEPDMKQDICFNHVSFSFGENQILDDVSFTVPAGTTLGVLGSTGSGKSTLINLLIRMYELGEDDGSITIGGVDIRDIKASWLRKNIGIVLQEPYLFSRTLRENIGIGIDHANEDTIREAARIASLLHTIEDFTKGFDTEVGERGVTLSGGQKQRTAIAQMIVGDTPVMVFDDSLSAVDAETDARIRDALRERNADTTTILVAHRITTLMNADQIIVMDRGRILESGTHEELLALGGVYRKIYDIQTEGGDYDAE